MSPSYIPTCFFPSRVVLVDDSRDFLINFSLQLNDEINFCLYDSPFEALRFLQQNQYSEQFNQRLISEQLDIQGNPLTSQAYNMDLVAIHWEVYNPHRFDEISIAIVDYAMPGMNGLEFFDKLVQSPTKKILLTGRADEKLAISAFNQGLIDCYIQKNDPQAHEIINDNIRTLQFTYFQSMSDVIVKMLSINGLKILQETAFIQLFQQICQENNIIEYYLTENSGSFLLLDINATPFCLIVKSKADLAHYCELAIDNKAPETVIEQLKNCQSVPYFWQQGDGLVNEWTDWSTSLYPAKELVATETYYYALIRGSEAFDIQTNKILSYSNFLEQEDSKGNFNESTST